MNPKYYIFAINIGCTLLEISLFQSFIILHVNNLQLARVYCN